MSIAVMPWRLQAIDRRLVAGAGSVCHTPIFAFGDDGVTVHVAVDGYLAHVVMDCC